MTESVTHWIDGVEAGEDAAAQKLWERYFERLLLVARTKLAHARRRDFDEEDVAISAFHSVCAGIKEGKFPRLADRNNLWSLLLVITARKAQQQLRKNAASKRGGNNVRGESFFGAAEDQFAGIGDVAGAEPTPEFTFLASEEFESLLALLPDDQMRQIALMKMEGYENQEIAKSLECGLRTIERRLGLIRDIWQVRGAT